jgi:CRISPR-associated protein Cst2
MNSKALTITFLTTVSFASLNGSDKEADNMTGIKKLTRNTEQYPYVSAQAIRRALRDQLAVLGYPLSETVAATIKKGVATTLQDPITYIDDDLFGFMGTEEGKAAKKRTSAVRVSPLISMNKYEGDLDFGTNFMRVKDGGSPNIYETEIHSGIYRGTILIELDRVGEGEGFSHPLTGKEKADRVKAFLAAFQNLWSSGRQSRYLADISPKFLAAALMTTKTPIFLETLIPTATGVDTASLAETLEDYNKYIQKHVYGAHQGMFSTVPADTVTIGEAFKQIADWIDEVYS